MYDDTVAIEEDEDNTVVAVRPPGMWDDLEDTFNPELGADESDPQPFVPDAPMWMSVDDADPTVVLRVRTRPNPSLWLVGSAVVFLTVVAGLMTAAVLILGIILTLLF